MNQKYRVLLAAAGEAVLVVSGDLELEDYGHWEMLLDQVVELCEELNDKKPSSTGGTRP